MRAAVVGGSGQIGGWLLRHLKERGHEASGTYATVPQPGLTRLDAADQEAAAAWLRGQAPDLGLLPRRVHRVDGCEREPARAYGANLDQPLNLARAAAERGARFVYFSTDYVFDGEAGPYGEDDPTNPLSEYGKSKRDAELALMDELGDKVLVARTSWVFGPERQGKNFAYQLAKTLAAGKPLVCPSDQHSNPSYGPDVALATLELAEQGRSGLVHVVGPEVMGRVPFARAIASAFDLNPELVVGQTTAELGQTTPRPLVGGLKPDRLDSWLPGRMRPLDDCLNDFRTRVDAREGWADPLAGA